MLCRYLLLVAALLFVVPGFACATHIHYEDLSGDASVDLSAASTDSYTWTFNLELDDLSLWVIPGFELHSFEPTGSPFTEVGRMDATNILHYAYLTMKFDNINDGKSDSDLEVMTFYLELDDGDTVSGDVVQGGIAPQEVDFSLLTWVPEDSSLNGGEGTINVTSYMNVDHTIFVTIKADSGSFTVLDMALAGCFEGASPVPEPSTLILLGSGLLGLAVWGRNRR